MLLIGRIQLCRPTSQAQRQPHRTPERGAATRTAPHAATMESIETQLLNKYNIPTLFPAQWPEEKDLDSDSEDDAPAPQRPLTLQPITRRKSRFSVLETSGSFARKRDGVEKTKEGVENLVQKDEQDPLGAYPSVVQVLRQRGLAVEDDVKLRMHALERFRNPAHY
jgi:hypothetical protein